MNTLIFSDTHFTPKFNQKRFRYLANLISNFDTIIINGDFWDGYLCSFDEFMDSTWRQLFPLLASKQTIYLFGNHDKPEWINDRASEFSKIQTESFDIKLGSNRYHIEHGGKIILEVGDRYPEIVNPLTSHLAMGAIGLGATIFGPYFYEHLFPVSKSIKKGLRQYAKTHMKTNEFLVVGHSHTLAYEPKAHFISDGYINYNYALYVTIIDEKIKLVRERY